MDPKKPRLQITLDKRIEIIQDFNLNKISYSNLAKKYSFSKSTIAHIIGNREKYETAFENQRFNGTRKRLRTATHTNLEEYLTNWLKFARAQNIPLSGPLLQSKAENFAEILHIKDFKCSNGWLERFKQRHSIVFKKPSRRGESANVETSNVKEWFSTTLPQILQKYEPRDIFYADETGLFWRLSSDKTVSLKTDNSGKDRVTVLVGANMDGSEKLPLLVVGKSDNTQCFNSVTKLAIDYEYNKNSRVTSTSFDKWLRKVNQKFKNQNRFVVMIVDNCSAHSNVEYLSNINLIVLPLNSPPKTQPMNQGVIQSLKTNYRQMLVQNQILSLDEDKDSEINFLLALHFLNQAWKRVPETTIADGFKSAKFVLSNIVEIPPQRGNQQLQLSFKSVQQNKDNNNVFIQNYLPIDDETNAAINNIEIVTVNVSTSAYCNPEPYNNNMPEGEEIVEIPIPSVQDVKNSLKNIRLYLLSKSNSETAISYLDQVESFVANEMLNSNI